MSDETAAAAAAGDLELREELTRRIFEAMPGGIVHVRIDGSIDRANAEAQRVLGLRLDQLTERYINDFEAETIREDGTTFPADEYPVTLALRTGEPHGPATIGVRRQDGSVAWGIFTAVPVHHLETGEVSGAVVTFLDITDRKKVESERRALQQRLVAADRMASVGTLAAGVAHEINNPLTYVLANLELLESELADLLEGDGRGFRLRARVRDAREGLDRIRNVVRDLNTFSHVDESVSPIDVHAVLESSLRMAANELRYRARIAREYDRVPAVAGNASRLGQVFLNLLVNAGHSIDAGNVDDNEVTVRTHHRDGHVVVEICDTGSGIPGDMLEHIFEPFVTSKTMGEGTGLGLYVCHGIVRELGGDIEVASSPHGTTFRVTLPICGDTPAMASDPALLLPVDDAPAIRVLVVDDEPGILNVFEQALARHSLTLATSGRQALHEIAEREFDLIFCDLIMPDVTGMEVYDALVAERPQTADRIVFMTGGAFTERARGFVESRPRQVLHKPFGEDELRRIVAEHAGR